MASASAPMSAAQLAAEFVQRDATLKQQTKSLAPVRRQRKEMYDHLMHLLEGRDPEQQRIVLGDGTVVTLKTTELAAPVKEDYVALKLGEILGMSNPQAEEVARRIWDERPKKTSYRVVYSHEGSGSGSAAAGASSSRKRAAARE